MTSNLHSTEAVLNNHLATFLEGKGVEAILKDYTEESCLLTEERVFRGKNQIREFFQGFFASLPSDALDHFALVSTHVDQQLAYITWTVKDEIFGTDTFFIKNGKIVTQTVAIFVPSPIAA